MRRQSTVVVLLIFSFLIIGFQAYSQQAEKYSRVKVYADNSQFTRLLLKGIALDELAEKTSNFFTGDFSAREIALMKEERLRIEYIIDDMAADFAKRNKKAMLEMADMNMRTGSTPPGFNYGSMGGYLTFNEMVAELDSMKAQYPDLITTKASIGNSQEGRPIWMVKISDNPEVNESLEEGVLYTGLLHAREPISMMNLIYFMHYILSRYNTDPEIACLINNRELYFIPCTNPDGYVYNQTTHPSGGGFWRKNRRNNGGGVFGVDLNRNFDYFWGYDNTGSSPTPSSDIYRGPSAFSEPEVAAIRDFVINNQLTVALNHHSYGNKLMLPFGYNNSPAFQEFHYRNIASMLTFENKYQYGRDMELLGYNANGRSDDWMHGNQNIIAYTPETGHDSTGFWPIITRIIPICEQNLDMNISAAWASGKYIKPRIAANTYVSGSGYNLPVLITNYSNSIGLLETVSLSINDPRVLLYDTSPILLTGLPADSTWVVNKNITFVPGATNGTVNANLVTTNSEGCVYNIPISFEYSPNGCFSIPSSWTAMDIGATGLAGSSCYQNGVYTVKGAGTGITSTSDKCHMMKLTTSANVWEIKAQVLTVQNTGSGARAGITISETSAPGSKRVTLLINPSANRIEFQRRSSTNGSITTISLNNQGAVPKWLKIVKSSGGNYYGYYSANGTSWTQIGKHKVTMNTSLTAGLVVTSGSNTVLHTATFNNLAVSTPGGVITKSSGTISAETDKAEEDAAISVYPNPTKGMLEIRLPVSDAKYTVRVFDLNGRQVYQEAGIMNVKTVNLSYLNSGLYYVQITDGTKVSYRKFVLAGN